MPKFMDSQDSGLIAGKLFRYVRCGYDSRLISFSAGGRIARGRMRFEMFWDMTMSKGKSYLDIKDDQKQLTCRLHLDEDGVWRGCWENLERMPIELHPIPAKAYEKALIIQHANGRYCEMLQIAFPRHSEYARRHGFVYWCLTGDITPERPVVWTRIALISHALRLRYDYVVWLDADTLIVDMDTDFREAADEFKVLGMCRHPMPWGNTNWHYNTGVILSKNNAQSRDILRKTWNSGPSNHPWQEQDRLMQLWEKAPDSILPIDNRWNSHSKCNPSNKPVVRAWHACGPNRIELMKRELRMLQKS
jgi:hypothetical protein